jgi:hypothetical protein
VISRVDLDLSDRATPWSALLIYRTTVDDETWAPEWTLGPTENDSVASPKTKLFAECPDRPLVSRHPIDKGAVHQGLREGAHSLSIEARLPGVDRLLRTHEKTVELSCSPVAVTIDPSASSASSGCSAAPMHRTERPRWWMLALLALAHARALRRSRNARGVSPVQRRNARKKALGSA